MCGQTLEVWVVWGLEMCWRWASGGVGALLVYELLLDMGLELDRGGAWIGGSTRRGCEAGFGDADGVGVGMVLEIGQ